MTELFYVVVPVYNEQKNIVRCLRQIKKYWPNVIVVNDGSTDHTAKLLTKFPSIEVVNLAVNVGKGKAMLIGARRAWKLGAKGIIFMDGDRQHHPKYIRQFVTKLKQGYDLVVGIRLLKTSIPLHRKLGNQLIALMMKWLFHLPLTDIMCGFRGLSRSGFKKLRWSAVGYGVETEMLVRLSQQQLPYTTLVVDTIYHDKYKGFSLPDGLKIILQLPIWKWRYR